MLDVSAHRLKTGDIARIDLDRLQLQRVQFESDVQTALVMLRTAKIQLLTLLNDRTPVEQFDVTGPFDFSEQVSPLAEFRSAALDARPDLKAAALSDRAGKDEPAACRGERLHRSHRGRRLRALPSILAPGPDTPSAVSFMGLFVSIPLRIFDRNQGERLRTKLDISRSERLKDAVEAQLLQRRRFGARDPSEHHRASQALQGAISRSGREGA